MSRTLNVIMMIRPKLSILIFCLLTLKKNQEPVIEILDRLNPGERFGNCTFK